MTNEEYLKTTIGKLSQPLDYKWKLQTYNNKDKKLATKATFVAYIDARDVTRRLNEVCTYGYHRDHFLLGNDVYCRIGLIMPDGSTIYRADAGESDNDTEKTKTAASDSFKRAAKEFGVGLFLYDMERVSLPVKVEGNFVNVVDDKGNKVWDPTKHINKLRKKGAIQDEEEVAPPAPTTPKKTAPKSPETPNSSKTPAPPKQKEELTPKHKSWDYAKGRVKDGVTREQIEQTFVITDDNFKLLSDAKNN